MMRRLKGAMIVLRVLLPVLIAIALILVTWLTVRQVSEATRQYGEELSAQLDEIREAVEQANEGLQAIGSFAAAATGAADALIDRVGALADSVSIPLPEIEIPPFEIPIIDVEIDLPDFTLGAGSLDIPIPGVEQLKELTGRLAEAGRELGDPVVKIAQLTTVPESLEEAAGDTVEYASEVRSSMWAALRWILAIALFGALVWAIAAVRPITDELRLGWAMMRGKDTDTLVESLEDRVRRLEKQMAKLR